MYRAFTALVLLMLGSTVFAQSRGSAPTTRTSLGIQNKVANLLKGDYRMAVTRDSSRFQSGIIENQRKLHTTGIEVTRMLKLWNRSWETGIGYETVGSHENNEERSVDYEISYITVPFLVRNQLTRWGNWEVIGVLGGKFAIRSEAEATITTAANARGETQSENRDFETNIKDYAYRAAVGARLENRIPNKWGFAAGVLWQRDLADTLKGAGDELKADIVSVNLGLLF